MKKKGNLASALSGFDRRPSETDKTTTTSPKSSTENKTSGQGYRNRLPPSRQGKKALTGYFEPDVLRQLKILAASEGKTVQSLMNEALNEIFKKYGRPHIA